MRELVIRDNERLTAHGEGPVPAVVKIKKIKLLLLLNKFESECDNNYMIVQSWVSATARVIE